MGMETMSDKQLVATYDYTDETGTLLYQVCRYEPKSFLQRRPGDNGEWIWNLDGIPRILYRLPELLRSSMQDWTIIAEGETDVNNLYERGFTATTNPMGAGKWLPDFNEYFTGRLVAVIPDNDGPGRDHAQMIARALYGTVRELRIVQLPGLAEKQDVTDWFNSGGSNEQLNQLIDATASYEPKPESISTSKEYPLTDAGNAERYASRQANIMRFVWRWDCWANYDGRRWNVETGEETARRLALETVRSIISEMNDQPKEVREGIAHWSFRSESAHRIAAMLTMAKAMSPLPAYPADFDSDPYLLNCANGTLNLRTGELQPHRAADMITKLCPVEYDVDAKLPLWNNFLHTTTGGDPDIADFLQIATGYSLTGNTGEEKLFFVHGNTLTGKSTFLEAVKATLGDYATTADFESFLKRSQAGGIRNDIAALHGARFVASIEVDEGRKLAEGLIKMLTGGDAVRARFLFRESFEFLPQCKLWLAANHAPKVSDVDDAVWRRIIRIPFDRKVERPDPKVKATLRDPKVAGPAILAWAVVGCRKWQESGLIVPELLRQSTQELRDSQNPLAEFFDDCLQFDPAAIVPVTELRTDYENWAKENGLKYPLSARSFNTRIEAKGCKRLPTRYVNDMGTNKVAKCWRGVTLQSNPLTRDTDDEDNIPI
jgi:putative DNA primase/helicase